MHKLYKEHYLYEMSDKNINSVEQIANTVVFDLIKCATNINCGDMITAKVVFNDVCTRLTENKTFMLVKKSLVNLDNITEVKISQSKNNENYKLLISFGEESGVTIICSSEEEAKQLESALLKKIVERKEELSNTNNA